MNRRLFECHITYDHVTPEEIEQLEKHAVEQKWKTSFIEGDPALGPGKRFFLTAHGADLKRLYRRMSDTIATSPVRPIREKIEEIVHDTKYGIEIPHEEDDKGRIIQLEADLADARDELLELEREVNRRINANIQYIEPERRPGE